MGFLNLFKNIGKTVDAKIQEQADKIEAANAVEFGKQDVSKMKEELGKINSNIGSIKGEIAVLKDKVSDVKSQVKKHEEDATALDAAGKEDLALKHCEAADRLSGQLEAFDEALKTQKGLLEDQIAARDEMKAAIDEAESDLVTMKAMKDVATANENLIKINKDTGTSAVASFKKRKEEMKKRMIKSKAMKEESGGGSSLEEETAKALGKSGGLSRLEKLRAKKA